MHQQCEALPHMDLIYPFAHVASLVVAVGEFAIA